MLRQEVTSRSARRVNEAHQDLTGSNSLEKICIHVEPLAQAIVEAKKRHGLDRELVLGCVDEENVQEMCGVSGIFAPSM